MAGGDDVNMEQPGTTASEAPTTSVQQSAADQNVAGWFYLDTGGQHVGPFTTDQLAGGSRAVSAMHPIQLMWNSRHNCSV